MRILILEDDPFIALDLQGLLEEGAHEVVGIYHSIQEVRTHLDDRFDYALLDIDLIDGKSYGIAAALMERDVPFAFVSASPACDLPLSLKDVLFIPKPFENLLILRSIEAAALPG